MLPGYPTVKTNRDTAFAYLQTKAQQQGRVAVIVEFSEFQAPELSEELREARINALGRIQYRILKHAWGSGRISDVKLFGPTSRLGMTVDAEALSALSANPLVLGIGEDRPGVGPR